MKSHVPFALACALLMPVAAARAEAPAAAQGPTIDIVLALDVSGSMSGLIDSAKIKLWDIVNDLAKDKPTPRLRVGLYSYGHTTYDPAKGWVRKEMDLTSDLDVIYQKLFALTIDGGEEYVARVSRDAIVEQKWSAEPGAIKHIFVCGNEPASQDPTLKLKDVAALAVKNGIHIHAIFCGNPLDADAADWKEFAKMALGQFAAIDMNNGNVVINTPMDKEMDALNRRLNTTYVVYGGQKGKEQRDNQLTQDNNALQLGYAANASRVMCKSGCLYRNDAWDLVDRCKNDAKFDVKTVPMDQLNDEMKKMTPAQREAYVKDMVAQRDGIQEQINAVGLLRQTYIQEELKKNPKAGDKAFDEAVKHALRRK